jgi:DNA-binding transcriptional MerR regulator
MRVFIREASKRGYPIENIVALLDEPGLTVEEAIERILSTRGQSQTRPEEYMKIARNSERGGNSESIRAALIDFGII